MKAPPDGWTRISSCVFYDDAAKAIDWLCEVFGFEVRLKVEGSGGEIVHSELVLPGGVLMVGQAGKRPHQKSPRAAGGNTQGLMVYVDDADATCERVRNAGAKITEEPVTSDYGEEYWTDRSFGALDCEGHHWWFVSRVSTPRGNWSEVRNRLEKH